MRSSPAPTTDPSNMASRCHIANSDMATKHRTMMDLHHSSSLCIWLPADQQMPFQWGILKTVTMHVVVTVHILYVSDSLSPIPFFTQEAGDLATNNACMTTTKDNNNRQHQGKQHVSPPLPPPLLFSHRQQQTLNHSTTPTMLQCHVTLQPTLPTTKPTTMAHKWWPAPMNGTRR